MTVRPLLASDFAKLAALLKLQDARPEYHTMAPESRDEQELALELTDESPYSELLALVLDDGRGVRAYVGVCNYNGEAFIEGPVLDETLAPDEALPLLEEAIAAAKARGYNYVDAFVDEQNRRAQKLLERAGFGAFRTTYIYQIARGAPRLPPSKTSPFHFSVETGAGIDLSAYRDLYRDTSDNWATRLAWSDEELIERFEDPQVVLVLASRDGKLVGHLELELFPEEGDAEIAYFGVLPEVRGQGLGRELLLRGLDEAFRHPQIGLVQARAHDDERAACLALEKLGFKLSRGVIAYTLELN
jgi:RimJ/RimL family protein N-acetyltransferase